MPLGTNWMEQVLHSAREEATVVFQPIRKHRKSC